MRALLIGLVFICLLGAAGVALVQYLTVTTENGRVVSFTERLA